MTIQSFGQYISSVQEGNYQKQILFRLGYGGQLVFVNMLRVIYNLIVTEQ